MRSFRTIHELPPFRTMIFVSRSRGLRGRLTLLRVLLPLLALGCTAPVSGQSDGRVELVLLQLNDVYEIQPIGGGKWGGLARVATLLKRLKAENPNTFAVMAGDFVSPSALGTARVDGERLAGRQMVSVLNAMGLDFTTFGNHEFDLDEAALLRRIGESAFRWTSANVTRPDGTPFPNVSAREILEIRDGDGDRIRLGMLGVTVGETVKDYVRYTNPVQVLQDGVREIADSVDVIVALTHLTVGLDQLVAQRVPDLDLIMGGHEHENMLLRRGERNIPIAKADANARSVYVHRILHDLHTGTTAVISEFVLVDDQIPDDPETLAVVEEWLERGFAGFRESGFEPGSVVAEATDPLDGLEASVRRAPTLLTQLLGDGMRSVAPGTELAFYNSGSIRIDDVIPPGPVTQYDVIRTLPFGGTVVSLSVRGDFLARTLDQGTTLVGEGGYLQWSSNVAKGEADWLIDGQPLDPARSYLVATNDYVANGLQPGLSFFNPEAPEIERKGEHGDIRVALIDALKQRFP